MPLVTAGGRRFRALRHDIDGAVTVLAIPGVVWTVRCLSRY